MRKFVLSLTILFFCSYSNAQLENRKGEFGLERVKHNNTILNLEPVYQRNPTRPVALDLADAFYFIQKYEKALMYYETAIIEGPLSESHTLNYFSSLFENGDMDLARTVANEYLTRFKKNELIAKMDTAERMKNSDPVYFEKNVHFNSTNNEYGGITYFDNFKFVNSDFTYDRKATKKSFAPYVIDFMDTGRGRPRYVSIGPKLPNEYDVISHYDQVEDKVYITRTLVDINGLKTARIVIGSLNDNFQLLNISEFPYNNPNFSVGQACVSQDGEMLYFVSDKPGGIGGADIYRCIKLEDGSWGFPINLGNKVNTTGDELYPYINPQGTTLYFASSGHSIMGGLDINKSEKTRSHAFKKPINLGAPFNSHDDDYALTFSDDYGTEGFFSSNRTTDGKGGDDVYSFSYENNKVCKDPVKNFKMIVVDKKTRERVANTNLKMTVKLDGRVYEDISDENGEVHLLVEGCNDFDVEATHDFYLNNLFYYDGFKKTVVIELYKKELDNIIGIDKIYYEIGKYEVPASAVSQLTKLATLLKRNRDIKIELSSHTDSRGELDANQMLSQKRSEHIVKFLTNAGVGAYQMIAKGYGETKLLNECADGATCTEEQHEKNRRTEFKILEILSKTGNKVDMPADFKAKEPEPMEEPKVEPKENKPPVKNQQNVKSLEVE
jgi:outer membrane protein OmpA-like peptidoglycan-associated protein